MKNALISAGVSVLVVVLGFFALNKPVVVEQIVGSASSPSVINGAMEINGVTTYFYSSKMANASTTCSQRSPRNATTTLRYAAAKFTNTYGGSFDVQWGTDPNSAFATTTSFGYKAAAIASGDVGSFVASTSPLSTATLEDPYYLLAPGTWVNFKIGSSSPTLAGTCSWEFESI